jgi:hypothetical protein
MSGMTFADASKAFERLQADMAQRGPAVPQAIKATIDFEAGATNMLWGNLAVADPLISRSAAILRTTTESTSERGLIASYEGHTAMYLGRNMEADPFLRESIESRSLERETRNPMIVYPYIYAAVNMVMQRRFKEARSLLATAPRFGDSKGKSMPVFPDNELRSAGARIALDSGDAAAALESMPPEAEDMSDNLFLFSDQAQLRGEILCATGHRRQGLARMIKAIDSFSRSDVYPHSPDLARARAVGGLCALADAQRRLAVELAALAHESFTVQPNVSSYFKRPSEELDRLLALRRTALRQVSERR